MSTSLTTGRTVSRQTDTPAEGAAYARLAFPTGNRDAGVELFAPALAVEPKRTDTLAFQVRVAAGTNAANDLVVTNPPAMAQDRARLLAPAHTPAATTRPTRWRRRCRA